MKTNFLKISILTLIMMFMFNAIYAQSNLTTKSGTQLSAARELKMSSDKCTSPVTHKSWVTKVADYRFDYINESFLTSIPATWTVIVDPISGKGWAWDDGSYSNYPYGKGNACANSDDAHKIGQTFLVSPLVDCSGASSLFLEFNYQFQQCNPFPDFGTVEVYDGTSWVVLDTFNVDKSPTLASYNVSSYKNANFQVRFEYNDGGEWAWMYNVSDVRVFSPEVSDWVAASGIIPEPTYLGSSADYYDGTFHYMYSFGGESTLGNETSIYTVETDSWAAGEAMPESSQEGCATTAGNYAYVLQGSDDMVNYTGNFYRYDILANSWSALASLPAVNPIAWTQIVTVGSNIYCVGGVDKSYNMKNSVYRYNIATDTWTSATDIPVALFGGSLTLVSGKLVYVMGVDVADNIVGTVYIGTIDGVSPDLITWTVGASTCPTPVYKIKACPWGTDKFIVTGGNDGAGGNWNLAIANSYTYDIVTDTWTTLMDKTTPTCGYAAASFVIGNEMRYYVATGYDDDDSRNGALNNVEYFASAMTSGINDVVIETSSVSLYPNPTKGSFNVEVGRNNSTVNVYNLMGEVISSKENVNGTVSFDLSNVASGTYLVKIISDNKVIDKKVNIIH